MKQKKEGHLESPSPSGGGEDEKQKCLTKNGGSDDEKGSEISFPFPLFDCGSCRCCDLAHWQRVQQRDAALPRLATDHRGRRASTGAALNAARQLGDSRLDARDAGLDR